MRRSRRSGRTASRCSAAWHGCGRGRRRHRAVDVLFVDEAGQMSLANVLAVSQAADSLVLLGDPRQLDQPQKASHPDGVGISALEHVLNGAETMPDDRGLFLPATYRMSPRSRASRRSCSTRVSSRRSPLWRRRRLGAPAASTAPACGCCRWSTTATERVRGRSRSRARIGGLSTLGPGTVTSDFAAESATVEESASKTGVTVPGPTASTGTAWHTRSPVRTSKWWRRSMHR